MCNVKKGCHSISYIKIVLKSTNECEFNCKLIQLSQINTKMGRVPHATWFKYGEKMKRAYRRERERERNRERIAKPPIYTC